ncbi:translation initiation factor IF-2 [Synergistes jonesii]|uniref:translation initiation factor IF-2 n=1 Tax=Synergistes jonesii TaxID=2754 RepID=UPI00242D5D9D|nr:translation initiation factor IF-2 [Synergistes jonesii]
MSKIRVYDLAKMLEKSSGEMMEILKNLNVEIKSHMSSIEEELVPMVESFLKEEKEAAAKPAVEEAPAYPIVYVREGASVADVAALAGERPGSAVKALMMGGLMMPASTAADERALKILGRAFKKNFVFGEGEEKEAEEPAAAAGVEPEAVKEQPKARPQAGKKAKEKGKKKKQRSEGEALRPPIVTVMGHVDHGKTTLLDNIRKTHVTEREAGGITQHIGASRVDYNGNTIVFLDTPGHEAFTAMRARGAQVTDIAILVVAADDGIKPQTIEAMNHAKAAGVPIVVAVNKIDKPEAKPERVRQQLSDYGLVPEEWGGDTIMVDVAAKKGTNVDELLEMLLLVAEMQELKADPNAAPSGTVIEANLDKGKGPVATVIVQEGTLRRGDIIHTGSAWGKIRAMIDDKGNTVSEAGPSMPVEILGLESVPQPGEKFTTLSTEREARDLISQSEFERRETDLGKAKRLTLEELYEKMQTEEIPQLRIVLKTDVQGSLEALHSSLMKMSTDSVSINIVHEGVGRISESDVMLASASNAIIIGFNVRPDGNAKRVAENEGVQIRLYQVIYDMLDDVKAAMEGMLAPELREHTLGQAEIREIFRVPKVGNIAGCRVTEGLVRRSAKVRLIRDGVVFWSGDLSSLKHFKDDVREIKAGNECGLSFEKFQDFKVGDVIEAYEILKEKKALE